MMDDIDDMEKAFNKELFLIKNDLYYQQLELNRNHKKELLRIDICYKPQSSLSGDTYSLRKTKEGRLVGFIADAMGKGTSAALTSMGTTRFLNYFFDELEEEGTFCFESWIKKFVKFMKKNLMSEELLSIAFIEFDLKASKLHYALFGMPAFLLETLDHQLEMVKSNNPPMMVCTDDICINTISSLSYTKMLCYSDGLSESFTKDAVPYGRSMKKDFLDSSCVEDFHQMVRNNIGTGDDDLTYIYMQKIAVPDTFEKLSFESTYDAIEDVLHTLSSYFKTHYVNSKCSSEIILTLSELLLNALEHGSFGVNKERKNYLIEHNLFEEEMVRLEAIHKHKTIELLYGVLDSGNRTLFEATICDQGEGFDTQVLKNLVLNADNFNGRGFVIIKKLLDHFYFNEKGNAITIQKFLTS